MIEPQYIEQVKVDDSLQYKGKAYRVQEDKNWLFIFPTINGKRTKVDIKNVKLWFDYGSHGDWLFNEWYKIYPDYEMFRTFVENERNSLEEIKH